MRSHMAHTPPEVTAYMIKLGRRGGKARAKSMTKEQRIASAKHARAAGVIAQQKRKAEEEQA